MTEKEISGLCEAVFEFSQLWAYKVNKGETVPEDSREWFRLSLEWAQEFEKKNEGREWDGEFIDEAESFFDAHYNEYYGIKPETTPAVDPDYPDGKQPEPPKWFVEFGADFDVPGEIFTNPLFEDESWHNDVCPTFSVVGLEFVVLWVDHPKPEEREAAAWNAATNRFCVALDDNRVDDNETRFAVIIEKLGWDKNDPHFATDSVEEALQMVQKIKGIADAIAAI